MGEIGPARRDLSMVLELAPEHGPAAALIEKLADQG